MNARFKRQAEAIREEIGLKPKTVLELFYKAIVKPRSHPFPALVDCPEDQFLRPAARRNALADEF